MWNGPFCVAISPLRLCGERSGASFLYTLCSVRLMPTGPRRPSVRLRGPVSSVAPRRLPEARQMPTLMVRSLSRPAIFITSTCPAVLPSGMNTFSAVSTSYAFTICPAEL